VRLYDWLLLAYPRSFRDRYGDDMRRTFARDLAEYSAQGGRNRAIFWVFTVFHALCFGLIERFPKETTMRAFLTFDLRDALRSLKATPVITAVAVLSLALGIGANTALFSILNGLVLKSLPVKAPQELALIKDGSLTNPIWEGIRDRAPQLVDGAFAWSGTPFDLATAGQRETVQGAYASGAVFDVLGVKPELGRLFTPADDVRGGGPDGPVVVISDRLWQTRFGGQSSVLGQSMLVNRVPLTIIGVTPPGFLGVEVGSAKDLFLPLADEAAIRGKESMLNVRAAWWLNVMVRRRQGQTLQQAALALNSVRPAIREETIPPGWVATNLATYLTDDFQLADASNGFDTPLRNRYAQPLTIIMFVVAAVLLIACANIANLLLARATARRHEMSLRMALGASRFRLVRQLLAESALLAVAGGVCGLFLAKVGGALLVRQLGTAASSVTLDLSIDWRVLAFTGAVALVTTLLFGLAPAAGLASISPNDALKEQTRSVTGDRRFGIRNVLVVTQVSLSLALVVGAGLFVRSFTSLATMPLGFEPAKLLVINVDTARVEVPEAARLLMFDRIRDAVAAVPGVRSASISAFTPISGVGWNGRMLVDGPPELSMKDRMIWVTPISSGWFGTYGMALRAGRDFSTADTTEGLPVIIVNETFVKRFVGDRNPIGLRTKGCIGVKGVDSCTIVGVVSDSVYRNARAGVQATVYAPMAQTGRVTASFVITADIAGDRASARRSLASAISLTDSRVAFSMRDFDDFVSASTSQERLVAMLSGFFGVLALLLAALGLYGVTSYSVNRRRGEIAVRIALGATAGSVVQMVLRRVVWLVLAGVVIGIGLSWWAGTYIVALLYGLQPRDPLTMTGAAMVLLAAGMIAGWLPARRAARLDPTTALRD
jgi:putative ABC transport system permease protein